MTRTPALTFSSIAHMQGANSRHMMGALRELGEKNLREKRRRLAREGMARIAAANRRPAPGTIGEPVKPADKPVTFKTERKPRRVTRPATTSGPTGTVNLSVAKVKESGTVMTSVTKRVTPDIRKCAERLELTGSTWSLVANSGDLGGMVYARKHGRGIAFAVKAN